MCRVSGDCEKALFDDRDPQPIGWKWLWLNVQTQTISIASSASAVGVQLMGRPELGGLLFDELGLLTYPIELFEFFRGRNPRKICKPLVQLQ